MLLLAALAALKEKDKKPYEKHDGSALNDSLRDVINTGVKMFNEQGDHAGCYRLFQGPELLRRPQAVRDLLWALACPQEWTAYPP